MYSRPGEPRAFVRSTKISRCAAWCRSARGTYCEEHGRVARATTRRLARGSLLPLPRRSDAVAVIRPLVGGPILPRHRLHVQLRYAVDRNGGEIAHGEAREFTCRARAFES